MFKKILLIFAMLYAATAFAAVDVNKATAAELDGIKGIGPGLSTRILDERKNGNFKDWSDFISRVSGVGEKTAEKFSGEGLTVNGKKFNAAAVAKAEAKATAKSSTGSQASKNSQKTQAATTNDKAGKAVAPAAAAAPASAESATKK